MVSVVLCYIRYATVRRSTQCNTIDTSRFGTVQIACFLLFFSGSGRHIYSGRLFGVSPGA